jgi:iron complex outermembrane receptor protein
MCKKHIFLTERSSYSEYIKPLLTALAFGLIVVVALPAQVYAQAGALEEIIVTAQYREENIQDVPMSISAISGDALASKNANDVIDIERWTPNLKIDHLGSGWGPTLAVNARGIGLNDFKAVFEQSVPIYIDDVLIGRPTGANLDLLDLERVEVLRGPQGTLFGSNAAGGVIRLISRQPTGMAPTVAEVTMGSYDRIDFRGTFETALTDNLFARFAYSSKRRDGYVDVLDFTCEMIRRGTPQLAGIGDGLGRDGSAGAGLNGAPDAVTVGSTADNAFGLPISTSPNGTNRGCKVDEMGDEDIQSGRVLVRWVINDDMEFTFAGDVTNQNNKSPADFIADTNPALALVSLSNARVNIPNFGVPYDDRFVPADPFVNYSTFKDPGVTFGVPNMPGSAVPVGVLSQNYPGGIDTPNVNDVLHWGVSGTLDWRFSDALNATVIVAYREFDSFFGRDSDGSPIPLNHTLDTYQDQQLTVEGRLSGQLEWSDWTTDWTTGVFYYDADDYNSNISILHLGIIGAGDIDRIDDQTSSKLGIFLHTITAVTDQITFTAGVRWTEDQKDILQTRLYRKLELTPNTAADFLFTPTPLSQQSNRVTPMASLSYQWNDDIMTYFTWQRGFRGGGFNPRPANLITLGKFGPEDVENFEVGVKSDWFDRRLRVNATGFYMDYTDLQLPAVVLDPLSGLPTFPTVNAGEADIVGVELDFEAHPFERVTIDGSLGWLGFSFVTLGNADPAVIASFPGGVGTAIANPCLDCRPLRTPEVTASIGGSYTTPIDNGDWGNVILRADLAWQSRDHFTQNNYRRSTQGAYGVLNARGTWVSANEDWEVTLSGTNLTDKLYKVSVLDFMDSLGGIQYGYARPREFAVSVKRRF